MTHYLQEIYRIWSAFPSDKVDSRSVQIIEGMMPNYSLADQQKLQTWIAEGTLFPNIEGEEDRIRIQAALLAVEGRILSLRLFFLDASCLQLTSLFLRQQLCVGKKKTIREAFMHRCKPDTQEGKLLMQVSEHEYEEVPFTTRSPQELADREAVINGMLQVWMACFRYFIEPRRCKGPDNFSVKPILDPEGRSRIVQLAERLGFNILKQDYLESPGVPVFRHVSKTLLGNVQVVDARKTNYLAGKFRGLYPSLASTFENPPLTTDIEERKASFRAGRPDTREYDAIRPVFFMKNIYSSSEPAKLYPTAFAVMREIFFSFFGRHHKIRTEEISSRPPTPPSPVQLDPHPIGTPPAANPNDSSANATLGDGNGNTIPEIHINPDVSEPAMDDIVTTAPIAAGFEDDISIGALNKRCEITVHRTATEILNAWFQHGSPDLIIFFLFDSRAYYKFLTSEELELRSTINTLSSTHYFLVINNNVAQATDRDDLVHESQTRRLLLVGRNDGPSYQGERFDENGCITLDNLKEYLGNFDVATGKRRAIEDDVGQIPSSKRKR
jgi:hypothetical protein